MTEHETGQTRKSPSNLPSLCAIVEAILFASDRPVSVRGLQDAIPEADEEALHAALAELSARYESETSGVGLQELADGYQLTTRSSLSAYVERFLVGRRRARLSRAALETLATIAYRQPVTRGEIEDLRGVDCGQVIHTLLTRELITVKGRSDALGRPLLYGTTPEFLTYFGLRGMGDLPNLDEIRALSEVDPLEDPEIREALEASGLLEGLDSEEEASRLADVGSDAVGSGEDEHRQEPENATGAKDVDLEEPQTNGRLEARDAEGAAPIERVSRYKRAATPEPRTEEKIGAAPRRRERVVRKPPTLRIVEADAVPFPDELQTGEFAATKGNGGPH